MWCSVSGIHTVIIEINQNSGEFVTPKTWVITKFLDLFRDICLHLIPIKKEMITRILQQFYVSVSLSHYNWGSQNVLFKGSILCSSR